jgi:hypothetical protein
VNNSPRRETAGGFSSSQAAPEQKVLGQKQQHDDLIDRKVAFAQYAGTKQKILEVFVGSIGVGTYSLQGRVTI